MLARRLQILLALYVLSCICFLTIGSRGNWEFVLWFRGAKLISITLVAIAVSIATILFQTISQNRILTPSIMGFDALYIADEVQTGLMRTGELWGITKYGVTPDIMVIGKGITGGMYPISCCVVNERAGQWLKQDGFAHMSTTGGAELGCIVALKVLEITQRPEVASMVRYVSDFIRSGLNDIQALYPDFFTGIRQNGVILGLEFNDPEGAKPVMRHLYEHGVWAITC